METEPIVMEEQVNKPGGMTRNGAISLVFAAVCFTAIYLFVSMFPVLRAPLGFFVLTAAFFLASTVIAVLLGGRLRPISVLALAVGLIAAAYRLVHGRVDLDLFPSFPLAGLAYAFYIMSLFGNASGRLGGRFLLDLLKSFVYMFISFASFFVAVFRPEGAKRSGRTAALVIAGVAISLVLVLIVGSLLSYDAHFTDLLPEIELDDVFDVFVKLLLVVPISAMTFGILSSSRQNKLGDLSTEESAEKAGRSAKAIPAVIVALPIISVLAVYVLFFVSQWGYYMSAFTHRLPDGYSFAEYAREGFFSLCVVAVINGVLIIVLSCFTKTKSRGAETLVSLLKIVLSLATLVLIATAVSKMIIYIDSYDLTRARLAVTVFLAFLAVAFLAVILASLFKKIKAIPIIIVAALLFLTAFSLADTNRFIAKYNVDSYLSGKHESIDIEYLRDDLGFSAVPELERLRDGAADTDVSQGARNALAELGRDLNAEWYEQSIPYWIAKGRK